MTIYKACLRGDQFEITLEALQYGEEIATCPSCSLIIRVIYDEDMFDTDDEDIDELVEQTKSITV